MLTAASEFFRKSGLEWANFHSFRRDVGAVVLLDPEDREDRDGPEEETGSLLSRENIDALQSFDEGSSGYFYKMVDYLETFVENGVKEGRFTEKQARRDLQIALWYAYGCNNIDEYEYYYRTAQWMPASEDRAAGCGMWFYRYSCALMYCGRLEEAPSLRRARCAGGAGLSVDVASAGKAPQLFRRQRRSAESGGARSVSGAGRS